MNALQMLAAVTAALAVSCSESHPKNQTGGETHFLSACIDGACAEGLSCVCGVCTAECDEPSECSGFDDDATCVAIEDFRASCDGQPSAERICDVPLADASVDAGDDEGSLSDPLVLLVIDTSGSMERNTECTCTTAACEECLPRCSSSASDKNRWTQLLEALTGTFDGFSCEKTSRSSWVYEFDRAYPIPYHRPLGTQRDDGVLEQYADRVRFGIATFDGVGSYERDAQRSVEEFDFDLSDGMDGVWSYPPVADWTELGTSAAPAQEYLYPGCPHPYVMNTGIRSRDAAIGALFVDMGETPRADTVDAIQTSLLATRPYGGTPIAASLDDLRVLFEHDPWMEQERALPDHRRHVILITDGRPDDDYRNVNCGCNEPGNDCSGLLGDFENAEDMHCPYPLAETSARTLVQSGSVKRVDVIGFSIDEDPVASLNVINIAREGEGNALFASTTLQLRDAFALLLNDILEESSNPSDQGCSAGDLAYAHGARWMSGCGSCECQDGVVRCGSEACTQCTRDWDCAEGEHCRFDGLGCGVGFCVASASEACDAPTDVDAVCGCDGETYDSPCDAPRGVAHLGACEGIACPWLLDSTVEHGAAIPSARLCDQCTCIDGESLCAVNVGTACYTCSETSPCAFDQACILPFDQCTEIEDPVGYCMNLPQHCPDLGEDEPLYCACDGNSYTECGLVLNGLTRADAARCEAD